MTPPSAPHAVVRSRLAAVPAALVTAVVTALLATLLVAGTSVPASAGAGSNDFPRMPRSCATPQEKIPSKPVVCYLSTFDRTRPTIVMWGDSHSWMFIPAVKKAVQGRRVNVVAVLMGSCPPMDNQVRADDRAPACFRSNALGIDLVRQLRSSGQRYRVLLAGSWQRYLHALKVGDTRSYVGVMAQAMRQGTPRLVRTLRSLGAQVDVVGEVATVPDGVHGCPQGNSPYLCTIPRKRALPELTSTRRWVADTWQPLLHGRAAIDVNPYICNNRVCRGKVGSTRTWFDSFHLSATMSAEMASYFAGTVDAVAPAAGPVDPGPTPDPDGCQVFGVPIC